MNRIEILDVADQVEPGACWLCRSQTRLVIQVAGGKLHGQTYLICDKPGCRAVLPNLFDR